MANDGRNALMICSPTLLGLLGKKLSFLFEVIKGATNSLELESNVSELCRDAFVKNVGVF